MEFALFSCGVGANASVIVPALGDLDPLILPQTGHAIDHPMLPIGPPAPPARQIAFPRLRLADAAEWVAVAA